MEDRTKDDWADFVNTSIDLVSGAASIPLDIWKALGLTVSEIMKGREFEFLTTTFSIIFRKKGAKAAPVQFGDEMPEKEKPKKHEAAYVWRSMFG